MTSSPTLNPEIASAVLRAVENLYDELIDLTQSLVACRTDSQSEANPDFAPEAERCQAIVAGWLEELGATVDRVLADTAAVSRVAGVLEGEAADVPWPSTVTSMWFRSVMPAPGVTIPGAVRLMPGRLWGRGAADMKGGVACALTAMRALRESGLPLAGDLWLHVVTDEEVVGRSTR